MNLEFWRKGKTEGCDKELIVQSHNFCNSCGHKLKEIASVRRYCHAKYLRVEKVNKRHNLTHRFVFRHFIWISGIYFCFLKHFTFIHLFGIVFFFPFFNFALNSKMLCFLLFVLLFEWSLRSLKCLSIDWLICWVLCWLHFRATTLKINWLESFSLVKSLDIIRAFRLPQCPQYCPFFWFLHSFFGFYSHWAA